MRSGSRRRGDLAARRIFTTLLLVGGIGVASYTFALWVPSAVAAELAWRKRMKKRIDRLTGHTIVWGFGRVGRTVCDALIGSDRSFDAVEQNPAGFRRACEHSCLAAEGSAGGDEALLAAGVERASHVVSAVDSEGENIVIALKDILIVAGTAQEIETLRAQTRAGSETEVG